MTSELPGTKKMNFNKLLGAGWLEKCKKNLAKNFFGAEGWNADDHLLWNYI